VIIMTIRKFVAPDINFGFAWESESLRLFIIHADGAPHEQIAAGVQTPEVAELLVNMWCRGYRSRAREITRKPGAKHYHLFAETGTIAAELGGEVKTTKIEGE